MSRFFTHLHAAVLLAAPLLIVSCTGRICHELTGHWTTGDGQEMVFQLDGKAMWLTRFGSQYDTVLFEYALDCNPDPATVELTKFRTGPFSGKSLYGILEWTSDTTFRIQYEAGMSADVRPEKFDGEETVRFSPAR